MRHGCNNRGLEWRNTSCMTIWRSDVQGWGGEVTFAYCQKEGGNLPCQRILACWQTHFAVETYLRGKLTEAEWECCFNRPSKDKVSTLIEMIEAAKKRKDRAE